VVVAVNGAPVANWPEFVDIVQHSGGNALQVSVLRDSKPVVLTMKPEWLPDEEGKSTFRVGIGPKIPLSYKRTSFANGFASATAETWNATTRLLATVSKLVTGKLSVKQLSGVVNIADQAGHAVRDGSLAVVNLMAIISLNLGVLNLLPIPILDGGNILLLAIEGLLRRDMSMAFKVRFVQVGLVFLLLIFTVVMYNDVVRRLPIHS
jgi:regulator of sigma E protease